jgi:hypothetical protein
VHAAVVHDDREIHAKEAHQDAALANPAPNPGGEFCVQDKAQTWPDQVNPIPNPGGEVS